MKIAYISEISPSDLNNWSGTPHYVYKILSENHTVVLKIRMQKSYEKNNKRVEG